MWSRHVAFSSFRSLIPARPTFHGLWIPPIVYITRMRCQGSYNEVPPFDSYSSRSPALFRLRLIALRLGLRKRQTKPNEPSCVSFPGRSLNFLYYFSPPQLTCTTLTLTRRENRVSISIQASRSHRTRRSLLDSMDSHALGCMHSCVLSLQFSRLRVTNGWAPLRTAHTTFLTVPSYSWLFI